MTTLTVHTGATCWGRQRSKASPPGLLPRLHGLHGNVPDRPRSAKVAPVGWCQRATMAITIKTVTLNFPKRWVPRQKLSPRSGTSSVHLGRVARDWRTVCHHPGSTYRQRGPGPCRATIVRATREGAESVQSKHVWFSLVVKQLPLRLPFLSPDRVGSSLAARVVCTEKVQSRFSLVVKHLPLRLPFLSPVRVGSSLAAGVVAQRRCRVGSV